MATKLRPEFKLRSHPLVPIEEPVSERFELVMIVVFLGGLFWGWVLF